MEYRNNEVVFASGTGSLVKGSFTVKDFSVTDGQDPDHHIRQGFSSYCGSDGKFNFSIGRKGSKKVAEWFSRQVNKNNTTFNHNPDDLNFAMLGTLVLEFQNNKIFTFNNIVLAQGHSAGSNNWWFGGTDCHNIGGNKVNTVVKSNKGPLNEFIFLRGGNSVNEISFSFGIMLNRWMESISSEKTLKQITIPGSHDAGMSELRNCAPLNFANHLVKTQYDSIGKQLENGSRYFDVRIDFDKDKLVTYHRTDGNGCSGEYFIDILNDVRNFLKNSPSEIAILKISHIRDYKDHKPSEIIPKINDVINNYSDILYKSNNPEINITQVKLGDLRGKMIVVFDYDDFINPAQGKCRYRDFGDGSYNLEVFDQYSDTNNYDKMKSNQLAKWDEFSKNNESKNSLFLLSWTLTPQGFTDFFDSIENMAKEANGKLPAVLKDEFVVKRHALPNIVYIDFLTNNISQSIVEFNF